MSSAASVVGSSPRRFADPASRIGETVVHTRSVLISVVFLSLVAAVGWSVDGWLMVRLRVIANDMFDADGRWLYAGLNVDAVNELEGYSPKRLAACLNNPSSKVRLVICLALSSRRKAGDAESVERRPARAVADPSRPRRRRGAPTARVACHADDQARRPSRMRRPSSNSPTSRSPHRSPRGWKRAN